MYGESGQIDEDCYSLGEVQAGETVYLVTRLPSSSLLEPVLEIRWTCWRRWRSTPCRSN